MDKGGDQHGFARMDHVDYGACKPPRRSSALITMKELEANAGQDLDAGWDDILPDVTSVSSKPAAKMDLADETDLDAGWDLDEQPAPGDSTTRKSRGKANRSLAKNEAADAAAKPTATLVQALSKRARRELERQNQIHATKRKLEAKAQRKQQRRAQQLAAPALHDKPAVAAPASELPSASSKAAKTKRRSQDKSRVSRPNDLDNDVTVKSTRKKQTAKPVAAATASVQASMPDSGDSSLDKRTPVTSSRWRRWALAIALIAAVSILAKWFIF